MFFNYPYPSKNPEDIYEMFDRNDEAEKRFISLPKYIRDEFEKNCEMMNRSDDYYGCIEDEYRY